MKKISGSSQGGQAIFIFLPSKSLLGLILISNSDPFKEDAVYNLGLKQSTQLLQHKHLSSPAIRPIEPSPNSSSIVEWDLATWMWLMELDAALNIKIVRCELPYASIQLLRSKPNCHHSVEKIWPRNLAWLVSLSRIVK